MYRTLTLHPDGTFTDYNEHLWDLFAQWVTEGVSMVVYAGTYSVDASRRIQLCYTRIVAKVDDVVTGKESLAADEPLAQPVTISGTMSAHGTSLALKPFSGAHPQTLVATKKSHKVHGGKYS